MQHNNMAYLLGSGHAQKPTDKQLILLQNATLAAGATQDSRRNVYHRPSDLSHDGIVTYIQDNRCCVQCTLSASFLAQSCRGCTATSRVRRIQQLHLHPGRCTADIFACCCRLHVLHTQPAAGQHIAANMCASRTPCSLKRNLC